jgi:hypothetical protein
VAPLRGARDHGRRAGGSRAARKKEPHPRRFDRPRSAAREEDHEVRLDSPWESCRWRSRRRRKFATTSVAACGRSASSASQQEESRFDARDWGHKISNHDLDERERAYQSLVDLACTTEAARNALESWSRDDSNADLAWTRGWRCASWRAGRARNCAR